MKTLKSNLKGGTMPKRIPLTAADWEGIYYALDYKLTSPALKGKGREARRWRKHLRSIKKRIGPDGDHVAKAGGTVTVWPGELHPSPMVRAITRAVKANAKHSR